MTTKFAGPHTSSYFPLGSYADTSVPYRPTSVPLTPLRKTSAELLQTSHIRLNVCDVECSILFTCSSNRRHIDLNICFASVAPYETGLVGHPVYVICGNVRPFRASGFGFQLNFLHFSHASKEQEVQVKCVIC